MPSPITICSGDYDRILAFKTGAVEIEGYTVDYLNLAPPETFKRLFTEQAFDISEMSFSTYLLARARGEWPYRALPVPLSRVFPHNSIYVREDSGIETAEDLKGRLVGIPNYHFTRGLCVRGMLADEYGVRVEDVRWRTGGVDTPGGLTYLPMEPPPGVEIEAIAGDETLGGLLISGGIDAIITYRDPAVFTERHPRVHRLFPDFRPLEQDYFRRTGVFPVMHVIGVHERLLQADPGIERRIFKAFADAKAACLPRLTDLDALAVTLPWLVAETESTMELMGRDFWPYGLEPNRVTFETQVRWSHQQGITPRPEPLADLFLDIT
ncbi:MAG: hypothetical protein OEY85_00380 [Rhodospirillales bacterium]|nr:hypothetical protein [Rhodospirillales bacterium]